MEYNLYKITNLINGKVYIGQTTTSLIKRWYKHLWAAKANKSWLIARAIRKYGADNFKMELLKGCLNKSDLDEMECFYIKSSNSKSPFGYNLTDGGEGSSGYKQSKEQIARMLVARKDYKPSEETKKKVSAKLSGRAKTKEHIENATRAKIGGKWKYEKRQLRSDKMKGVRLPHILRPISQYTTEMNKVEDFDCIRDAMNKTGILETSIHNCLNGISKTSGGYKWTYQNKSVLKNRQRN